MSDTLINKIAESGLITLRPEEWISGTEPASLDLKDFLFMGLILKEKEFRAMLSEHVWAQYAGKTLCVFCSVDAIIPSWAYMLIAANAAPYTAGIFYGSPSAWQTRQVLDYIGTMDADMYADQRVIIKGCSDDFEIGPEVYIALTHKLVPVVKSLMFGEPCSTVPVFKRPKGA